MTPHIIVRKSAKLLEFHRHDGSVNVFPIVIGFSPTGNKEAEGDGRTPEGEFYVFTKNHQSRFHRSLGLSYPRPIDAECALSKQMITRAEYDEIIAAHRERRKPPQNTCLGGEIYIHGGGIERESTRGCIGLDDPDIEQIFDAAEVGMRVVILP